MKLKTILLSAIMMAPVLSVADNNGPTGTYRYAFTNSTHFKYSGNMALWGTDGLFVSQSPISFIATWEGSTSRIKHVRIAAKCTVAAGVTLDLPAPYSKKDVILRPSSFTVKLGTPAAYTTPAVFFYNGSSLYATGDKKKDNIMFSFQGISYQFFWNRPSNQYESSYFDALSTGHVFLMQNHKNLACLDGQSCSIPVFQTDFAPVTCTFYNASHN